MKRHLNTLYVTTDGAYLNKQGEAVCVVVEGQVKLRIPLINLSGICCFGAIACSPFLLGACAEACVTVSFFSHVGRFMAAVIGFSPGNVILRKKQYLFSDSPDFCKSVARNMILAKLANARTSLLRGARESSSASVKCKLKECADALVPWAHKVRESPDVDDIRGLEGVSARFYFEGLNYLIKPDTGMVMSGRSRRPPLDPVNALLSFLYSILSHDARSACEAVGLDAANGFMHRLRPGRPSLALDLMEEFRPILADRLALTLINRRQVAPSDFETLPTGGVSLSESGRKTVLFALQQRKETEVMHPILNEKVTVGLLPLIQAKLLAKYIRGDISTYPAFVWR